MTGPTKMIIITSDKDIIRQFDFNKSQNTHIIDMDNKKKMTSIKINDNNTIHLNFHSESTVLNSNNDQVHKRAVDTTDHNQSKPVKTRKKSTDLICTICGDRAIGYNYAVLSCASCKAFFHRNSHQDLKRFKCLTGYGQCVIEYKISRKCYRCRLERCFAMGMRKDLILSQEEIQRRKDSGRNRNTSSTIELTNSSSNSESVLPTFDEIDRLFMDMNQDDNNIIVHRSTDSNEILLKPLTAEDLVVIYSIESSFLSIFQNKCEGFTNRIDLSGPDSELIGCLQFNNEVAHRIIRFSRLINEFENLDVDDRFIMIKYNLLPLSCIMTCYRPKLTKNGSSDRGYEEADAKRQIYMLCNQSDYMYEMVINLGITFSEIVEQDDMLLPLLLTVFLFSKGLSMNENEPSFKDSLSVYRAQSYYTKLLWNYMIEKHGETKTCKHFTKLLTAIFRAQSAVVKFREFLSNQVTTLDAVDEIAPLMQTILHIS